MASHAYSITSLLPATSPPPTLLGAGPRSTPAGGPDIRSGADEAIQAIRESVERYLRENGAIAARRGVAYQRRGAWAAFLHTGERVGQFDTAREATAALGGVA